MNKLLIIASALVALMFLTLFTIWSVGYSGSHMSTPLLMSHTTALRIRWDYSRRYSFLKLRETWVSSYLGNFSGNEVIFMGSRLNFNAMIRHVEIAGYTIEFGSSQEAYVYENGNFHTIAEAYDAGLITAEDVYEIGRKIGFAEDLE
jgi:hypothetical protein